jgi:hypothetical protein
MFSSQNGSPCRPGQLVLAKDWTFTVVGVYGTCVARFSGLPRWFGKSIIIDEKDVTGQPISFAAGQQLRGVDVVFTDRQTVVELTVTDDRGQPTRDYVALLFPTDRARWTNDLAFYIRPFVPPPDPPAPPSGTAYPSAPATHRRDTIKGMPPGEYYAIAVDDLEIDGFRSAEFLEQVSTGATRVALAEGVPVPLSLRRLTLAR